MKNIDGLQPLKLELSRDSDGGPDFHNMKVWRIEFSDHDPRTGAAAPPSPPLPQRGPLPAPQTDVFGPWFVTGAEWVSMWSDYDHPGLVPGSKEASERFAEARAQEDAMRQQCLERYPLNAEQRAKQAKTVLVAPPQTEAADPGWPEVVNPSGIGVPG